MLLGIVSEQDRLVLARKKAGGDHLRRGHGLDLRKRRGNRLARAFRRSDDDLGERLRVGPHLRYHVQSGASFYRLAYAAGGVDQAGPFVLPALRTGDRELSTMMSVTAGGSVRVALTGDGSAARFALILSSEVLYSYYFESLFVRSRTAVYGTVGFEVEL